MTSRSVARGVAGWLFGLSVTVLLISVWGRSVVVDTSTLGESLSPLARSVVVEERFGDWMVEGLTESGVQPAAAEPAVANALTTSAVVSAFDDLVVEVVEAAASVSEAAAVVDVAGVFRPAVPEITQAMTATGLQLTGAEVGRIVDSLDPLVIREEGSSPLIGPGSRVAARLGFAAVLSLAMMGVTGWVAVASAHDRMTELKGLLMRVALGGLTFSILLRVGSWILDPGRGRAPVGEALSELTRSKWLTPLLVAALATAAAGALWVGRRWLRQRAVSRLPSAGPTPPAGPRPSQTGSG